MFGEFGNFGVWTTGEPEFTTGYEFGAHGSLGPASFGPTVWTADWSTGGTNDDPDVCLKADGSIGNNIQPGSVEHPSRTTRSSRALSPTARSSRAARTHAGGIVPGAVTDGEVGVLDTDYTNGNRHAVVDRPEHACSSTARRCRTRGHLIHRGPSPFMEEKGGTPVPRSAAPASAGAALTCVADGGAPGSRR